MSDKKDKNFLRNWELLNPNFKKKKDRDDEKETKKQKNFLRNWELLNPNFKKKKDRDDE